MALTEMLTPASLATIAADQPPHRSGVKRVPQHHSHSQIDIQRKQDGCL
jgi:hypothetical protein